jgi:hypothetical protein
MMMLPLQMLIHQRLPLLLNYLQLLLPLLLIHQRLPLLLNYLLPLLPLLPIHKRLPLTQQMMQKLALRTH